MTLSGRRSKSDNLACAHVDFLDASIWKASVWRILINSRRKPTPDGQYGSIYVSYRGGILVYKFDGTSLTKHIECGHYGRGIANDTGGRSQLRPSRQSRLHVPCRPVSQGLSSASRALRVTRGISPCLIRHDRPCCVRRPQPGTFGSCCC